MTEDIKRLFTEHRSDGERPLRIDTETVSQGGRRRRRRRTVGLVTAAVVMVAALTAGTVTVPRYLSGSADAADDTDGAVEQPSHPLPDLEPLPDEDHYLAAIVPDDEGKRSTAADEYGDAYVDWFTKTMGVEFTRWPGVRVFEEEVEIWSGSDGEVIETGEYWPPRYRIAAVSGGGLGGPTSGFSHSFSGDDFYDRLSLTVYPRDSYLPGSGEGAEYLQDCEDREYGDIVHETTCTDATGPAGERILRAVTEDVHDRDAPVLSRTLTVTVYREDGTAVQVSDMVPGVSMDDATGTVDPDLTPRLDFDDLTDLALSMPDAMVTG